MRYKTIRVWALLMIMLLAAFAARAESPETDAVTAALAARAGESDDAWERFLLAQEIADAAVERDAAGRLTVRFSVPAWNPGLNAAERVEGDPLAKMRAVWQNAQDGRVEGAATLAGGGNGTYTATVGEAFFRGIRSAAQKAKRDFDDPRLRRMLAALLLPEGETDGALDALCALYAGEFTRSQLACALACQGDQSLNVAEGPDKLRLAFYALNPDALLDAALDDAMSELAGRDKANAYDAEQISDVFAACLAARARRARADGAAAEKRYLTVDFAREGLAQARNADFETYVNEIVARFAAPVEQLSFYATTLPDYPQREAPESGMLTGGEKGEGTRVIFAAPDDARSHYARLTDANGNVAASVFLAPGRSASAYVKPGDYTLFAAEGHDWFGEAGLFGADGAYAESAEPLTVLDETHYHRVMLDSVTGANTRMRRAAAE